MQFQYKYITMKKTLYLLLFLLSVPGMLTARSKQTPINVQPTFWWSGMKNPSLQLLLHADNIGNDEVKLRANGICIDSIFRPHNRNYLLLYLNTSEAAPQHFDIILGQGRNTRRIPYELKSRNTAVRAQGFDASDVLYLLMPDRFANGNPQNDVVKGLREATSSQAPDARHGGDLAGMTAALDYLGDLGITAVWPTPLLINDMPATSYHGYAITDYYQVDPRYGSNDDYCRFVETAHAKGIKVVQDMVFNHCGSKNFLFTDLPDSTWFNYNSHYVQTSYKISAVSDSHAAVEDARNAQDGWFVDAMPDFNQRNHHVLTYLIQNSIWWIEYAGIDGIRQDTYPYADRKAMAQWNEAVKREYPHFTIVGETWLNNNVGVSYWQKDSPVAPATDNSQLPCVMDFPLMNLLNSALDEETSEWDRGLARIYDYISQDAVYANPDNLLTFLDNHDTPRFARRVEQANHPHRYRQALTLLLTLRGIPQVYYGDELAMAADKDRGDGALRQNFPGGFPGDTVNAFTHHRLTPLMQQTFDFTRKLLRWRRGNEVIAKGQLKHYAVKNGTYVYSRYYKGRRVTVIINGTDKPVCLPLARYAEVLPAAQAYDVISGRTIQLDTDSLQLGVRDVLVLDFQQADNQYHK